MAWALIALGLLACAALAELVVTIGRSAGLVAHADVAHFIQRHEVPVTERSWRLVDRYLSRTRRFRTTWLAAGIVVGIAVDLAWYQGLHAGFNPASPMADLVLLGLGAWFVGLMHAEAYNRRPRYHGARLASLEPRRAGRYRPGRTRVAAYVIAGATALACAGSLATITSGRRAQVVALTFVALAVAVGGELCQRGIVRRVGVVTSADLRAADEAIRAVAAEAVDLGGAGVLLVITGWQLSLVFQQQDVSAGSGAPLATAITIGLLVGAALLAREARRLIRPTARQRVALARQAQAAAAGPVPDR